MLSITERVVHFHNHDMKAENAPDVGLVITICLRTKAG